MLKRKAFYFLRHGETDWNLARRLQGQTDIPLNENGREQARAVGHAVAQLDIGKVYASPLGRAYETAQLASSNNNVEIEVAKSLQEVTIGERDGDLVGDWFYQWKAGEIEVAGAEKWSDFRVRIIDGINIILESEENALLVSHGGVYGALTGAINITPEVHIGNCMLLHLTPAPQNDEDWLVEVLFKA